MNLIAGTVASSGSSQFVKTNEGLELPLLAQGNGAEGWAVQYGFRPEHLRLCSANEGIAAEIIVVEPMGSETQVHMNLAGEPIIGVFRERITKQPGEIIHVLPDASAASIFDNFTGAAI